MTKKHLTLFPLLILISLQVMSQEETSQRKNMEDAFISRMKAVATDIDVLTRVGEDTLMTNKVEGENYYTQLGGKYIFDEITSNTYYIKRGKSFQPLCDKHFPKETIANRLLLSNNDMPKGIMSLKFQKYRYETDSVNIAFKQFVTFCKNEGYDAYVGIEHIDKKEINADVFIYNAENKWLHLIYITCPIEDVSNEGLVANGYAWLFIPTSNLRELMGKELPEDFMDRLLKIKGE